MAAFCLESSSSKAAIRLAASCNAARRASESSSTRLTADRLVFVDCTACSVSPRASTKPQPVSATTLAASLASFSALLMSFCICAQAAPSSSQATPSPIAAMASHWAQASACSLANLFRTSSSASVRQASNGSACSSSPFCKAFRRFFMCDRCFCSSSSKAAARRAASASRASCSSWSTDTFPVLALDAIADHVPSGNSLVLSWGKSSSTPCQPCSTSIHLFSSALLPYARASPIYRWHSSIAASRSTSRACSAAWSSKSRPNSTGAGAAVLALLRFCSLWRCFCSSS
mmetsp:Transcript_85412/g.204677  ORF Transcript_85412/g.204677 Transcript_85412/m.204677 type:complete len:288 (-) Transcript_85412:1953-2816(-)